LLRTDWKEKKRAPLKEGEEILLTLEKKAPQGSAVEKSRYVKAGGIPCFSGSSTHARLGTPAIIDKY